MRTAVVKRETIQRKASPTAMLIGLPETLAAACASALAACERIPVIMPQVVVVLAGIGRAEADLLADGCVAVGAEVLRVTPAGDIAALGERLKDAANVALIRTLRSS